MCIAVDAFACLCAYVDIQFLKVSVGRRAQEVGYGIIAPTSYVESCVRQNLLDVLQVDGAVVYLCHQTVGKNFKLAEQWLIATAGICFHHHVAALKSEDGRVCLSPDCYSNIVGTIGGKRIPYVDVANKPRNLMVFGHVALYVNMSAHADSQWSLHYLQCLEVQPLQVGTDGGTDEILAEQGISVHLASQ